MMTGYLGLVLKYLNQERVKTDEQCNKMLMIVESGQ